MRQDTIVSAHHLQPIELSAPLDTAPRRPSRPETPYQVLRMLPKDATPAQQDSAIQAWFQPGEIHYSSQPDTLHLPGHGVGRNLKDVDLPQYYRESFFSKDSLLHPELNGGRYGMPGDPVPYTVRGDNFFTGLLLLCFVLAMVSFAHSRRFIARQVKDFFYIPHTDKTTVITETSSELRFQFFLGLQASLLLAIGYYLYVIHAVADTFTLENDYQLIGILFGVFVAYFLLKALVYTVVDCVFFDSKKNKQWQKAFLFLASFEGVLLFPAVLLQVYFNLPVENVAYYFSFSLVLVKMLTFYKTWAIFFRRNTFPLQIFLYFCALEIIPLLALWGGLTGLVNELKINF